MHWSYVSFALSHQNGHHYKEKPDSKTCWMVLCHHALHKKVTSNNFIISSNCTRRCQVSNIQPISLGHFGSGFDWGKASIKSWPKRTQWRNCITYISISSSNQTYHKQYIQVIFHINSVHHNDIYSTIATRTSKHIACLDRFPQTNQELGLVQFNIGSLPNQAHQWWVMLCVYTMMNINEAIPNTRKNYHSTCMNLVITCIRPHKLSNQQGK